MAREASAGSEFLPVVKGFSTVEFLATIGIIGIVSAMGVYTFNSVLPSMNADSAMQVLQAQLRQARQTSVDQRRNIQVTLQGTGEIVTVRQNLDLTTNPPTVVSTTTLSDYFLPNQMTYLVFAGTPDTPDGFGKSAAVNFNCGSPPLPCTITFQSDGTVVDRTGAYINGTVFMGIAGNPVTARAITILGATGRIKAYRYGGSSWS
jgi:type II secretory pathway pseudopilin PulG